MLGTSIISYVELQDVATFDYSARILAKWERCHLLSVELFAICTKANVNKRAAHDLHRHKNSDIYRKFVHYRSTILIRLFKAAKEHQQTCIAHKGNPKFLRPRTACPDKKNKLPFRTAFLAGDLEKSDIARIFIYFRTQRKKVDGKTIYRCLELNGEQVIERIDLRSTVQPNPETSNGLIVTRYKGTDQDYWSVVKPNPPYSLQQMDNMNLPPKGRLAILIQLVRKLGDLHNEGLIVGDLFPDEIGIDFKEKTVTLNCFREPQKPEKDEERWIDLWSLNAILSQILPPKRVEPFPTKAKAVLKWIQSQLTMEAITHDIIATKELLEGFRLCRYLAFGNALSASQRKILVDLKECQQQSAKEPEREQIHKAWEERFPDHYKTLYRLASQHDDHPFLIVLDSSKTGLPWRITLQPTGERLPKVYVHFDEMLDSDDDYDLYNCLELHDHRILERIERRSLDVEDETRACSPAKKVLRDSFKTVKIQSKRIVEPLCQCAFRRDEKQYLSVIMPTMDLHMGELNQIELTPLERLQLFEGVVEALADLHAAGTLHRDVSFEKFMFNRNDLKVKAIDAGENIEVKENPPWGVDLTPLGHKFLPLCQTETFSKTTQEIFKWLKHRLSPDPALNDPIPTSQLLLVVQLCRTIETEGKPDQFWEKLDRQIQVELIGWWKTLDMELPPFVEEESDADTMMRERLELLLKPEEPSLPNLLGLAPLCFMKRERHALREWIQACDPPKSSLAAQALAFFDPEQHHNLCMPVLLYARATIKGDESAHLHLVSLSQHGTYLADLVTHFLTHCDLTSDRVQADIVDLLPSCFHKLDPNGKDPIPGTLEFRLRCIRAVVIRAKESKEITELDKLIKHWLEGKGDAQFNTVIEELHKHLVELRAQLVLDPNTDCKDVRHYCIASLDWAISLHTNDNNLEDRLEAYTAAISPHGTPGTRSD